VNDEPPVTCPSCGVVDDGGHRFCTQCGTPLPPRVPAPPPLQSAGAPCPRCGATVASGLAFCTSCGLSVAAPVPAASPAPTGPPPGAPRCPTCGYPSDPGERFCVNCGRPTAGAATTPIEVSLRKQPPAGAMPTAVPVYAGPAAGPSRRPRRWPWLVAAAVVALALGLTGGYLVTRDDDSSEAASDSGNTSSGDESDADPSAPPSQPDDSDESEDADPETEATAAPTVAPSGEPSTAPVGAVCWNGTDAESLAACSRPQGVAGLGYVFPTLNGQDCTDITTPEQRGMGRKLLLQCLDYLPDGTEIRINYSQWTSVSAGFDHYETQGLARTQVYADNGDVSLFRWDGVGTDGEYKTAGLYGQEPYSSSVYAPSAAALQQALTTLVAGRPVDQVRGQPVG